MTKDSLQLNIELYEKMYMVRQSEKRIIEEYHKNCMKTPMHMSMGEEAIIAGIVQSLTNIDQVFGTYRSHALYLNKTDDINGLFAEMYGKQSGCVRGVGGSMHLCNPDKGFMGTSAIVSGCIPLAIGAAFANKYKNNNKKVVVFFGDGATEEGNFWESINVAGLMRLPILFVCEDNGYAVHTPKYKRQSYQHICDIVEKFNITTFDEDSTDAENIFYKSGKILECLPAFFHCKYYRYLEHVGINTDFDAGYRSKEEFDEWFKCDPIKIQRTKFKYYGCEDRIEEIEKVINNRIDNAIKNAEKDVYCAPNNIL